MTDSFSDDPLGGLIGFVFPSTFESGTTYLRDIAINHIHDRMVVHQVGTYDAYRDLVQSSNDERRILQDGAFQVGPSLFPDDSSFVTFKRLVVPRLLSRSGRQPIRVWVIGCASGELVYSIAILLKEAVSTFSHRRQVVVFGTDLDPVAVAFARKGCYTEGACQLVPATYLDHYFNKSGSNYVVDRTIRELCVFAKHDPFADPPFGHLDFISCAKASRYASCELAERVLPAFHFGLGPRGLLLLGLNVSFEPDGFDPVDEARTLWSKSQRTRHEAPKILRGVLRAPLLNTAELTPAARTPLAGAVDRALSVYFSAAAAVVRADGEILELRGDMERFFVRGPRAGNNLLTLIPDELRLMLAAALRKSTQLTPVRVTANLGHDDRPMGEVLVTVLPIPGYDLGLPVSCVVFEPRPSRPDAAAGTAATETQGPTGLFRDLKVKCGFPQAVLDRLTKKTQDIPLADQDKQALMEELTSLNEELQTSKEQLEAGNQDLWAANQALELRTRDLLDANDDMRNLFDSAAVAALFVTMDMRIKLYTPLATKIFNVRPSDIGRAIADISCAIPVPDMHAIIQRSVLCGEMYEARVRSDAGDLYLLRVAPYLTEDHAVSGATITAVNIESTALRIEDEAVDAKKRTQKRDSTSQPIAKKWPTGPFH